MAFRWQAASSYAFFALASANQEGPVVEHRIGAICNGITQTAPAEDFLRGKHLSVYDTPWNPFAIVDETVESGWRGYDVDLLEEIAAMLGFTYTIHSFKPEGNETWTDCLYRVTKESDVVMSYWVPTQDRMNWVTMIAGHLDYSAVVVARETVGVSVPIWHRMTAFLHPYTGRLWICIVLMIILSGFVDYLLERRLGPHIKLGPTLFEFAAGILWGGFSYPRTFSSALYKIIVAFLVLVTVSTYTANLTTFLTASLQSVLSATSVEDVMQRELTACTFSSYLHMVTYDAVYPRLQYTVLPKHKQVRDQLATGCGCDAAIIHKLQYEQWRMGKEACTLRIVQSVFADRAGWATNQQSPCVQQAFEWALHNLILNGKIDRLNRKWLPAAKCSGVTSTSSPSCDEETLNQRRLYSEDDEQSKGFHSLANSFRSLLSRRLLGARSKSESGSDDGEASDSDVGTMSVLDFSGIFSLWGISTVGVLLASRLRHSTRLTSLLKTIKGRVFLSAKKAEGVLESGISRICAEFDDSTPVGKMRTSGIRCPRIRSKLEQLDLNIDDQSDMLFKIMLQVLEINDRSELMMTKMMEDESKEFHEVNSQMDSPSASLHDQTITL